MRFVIVFSITLFIILKSDQVIEIPYYKLESRKLSGKLNGSNWRFAQSREFEVISAGGEKSTLLKLYGENCTRKSKLTCNEAFLSIYVLQNKPGNFDNSDITIHIPPYKKMVVNQGSHEKEVGKLYIEFSLDDDNFLSGYVDIAI